MRAIKKEIIHYNEVFFSNGASVIDLVWANFSIARVIHNFEVLDLVENSCHLPCLLSLEGINRNININIDNKVMKKRVFAWNADKSLMFRTVLNQSEKLYFNSCYSDSLYNNVTQAINETAKQLDLIKDVHGQKINNHKSPWFNAQCSEA